MKKHITNSKGITLISLIIMIIVLIILASITVYSGKNIIETSRLSTFTTEIKILQMQVNELYEKYKNGETIQVGSETYTGNEILTMRKNSTVEGYSTDIENSVLEAYSQADKIFKVEESGITNKEGYLYFNKRLIQDLNISGVDEEFFVNIATRSVISYTGCKSGKYKYYTLEQIPKSLYNVNNIPNNGKPTFDIDVENIAIGKWRITISNITYLDGYIEKWYVKYRLSENDDADISEEEKKWNMSEDLSFIVNEDGNYEIYIQDQSENVISDKFEQYVEGWEEVSKEEWKYDYGSDNTNEPKLVGNMKPINYVGEIQAGNKWANAITTDGSMWVWIPRYAYKITEGYHSNITGKIEIAFLDINNNFLNGETGEIKTKPEEITYTDNVQNEWLVHPAFIDDSASGYSHGGWNTDLTGIWIGKFEATGTYDSTSETGTLSVRPGQASLCKMTINQQYKLAKSSTFWETTSLNSHMAKNSEWGATAYLAHSKYGTNAQEVEDNREFITGGSSKLSTIYTRNIKQSTTHNANGVYDMSGGAREYVASYIDNESNELASNGGIEEGDLYGTTIERESSTAYKMVYTKATFESENANYEENKEKKGDAIWETTFGEYFVGVDTWGATKSYFPNKYVPFFTRGGNYNDDSQASIYNFHNSSGVSGTYESFRPVLCP